MKEYMSVKIYWSNWLPLRAIFLCVRAHRGVCALQMSVGQRVELTVQPEHGYGMHGYPPIVPANAVLVYDIELLSFASP